MRTPFVRLLAFVSALLSLNSIFAMAATGPQTAWSVFTLPNPQITPGWRTYAPADCQSDPDACAQDQRFWEQWDFRNFQTAIDASFAAVSSMGQYQGVMMLLPLGDTSAYWSNIQLTYKSASSHGVQFEAVVFPKWKYGPEYCYLYRSNAPSGCQLVSGTTGAVAYQKMIRLMNFVQNLSGTTCTTGRFHRRFAVWYGWSGFFPGYDTLKNFWQSLPTSASLSGCNLRAAYITWLDTHFSGNTDVQQLQSYVLKQLRLPYWVNTELYSSAQLEQFYSTYAPYQTIITGYWGASNITTWAEGMCVNWNTARQPARLGAWTFYDPDFQNAESYRAYINDSMAVISSICTY